MLKRFKALIEANISLAGIESLDELLFRLTTLGNAVTNAEAVSIMLYNPEKGVLQFVHQMMKFWGKRLKTIFYIQLKVNLAKVSLVG